MPPKKKATKTKPAKKVTKKAPAKKAAPKKDAKAAPVKHVKKTPQPVRGMKDIYPPNSRDWMKVYHAAEGIADAYNFDYFSTPIVEEAALFQRTLGRTSDVVKKEMYVFENQDGTKLALRPELTAPAARAYITNGMVDQPQPVKLWYFGPMFRHDRPQAGRYRQFHQFGCETMGVHDPAVDAELISASYHFLKDLGINANVHVNSIGTPDDRERYIVELTGYFRSKRSYLSEESRKKITKNPLRIFDSKHEQDQEVIEEAPQILDWLSDKSKEHFMAVLEYLDEIDVPYVLDPTLVRGLDYYTDTVFEFFDADQEIKAQSALGGGGRYNLLIEELGGQPTPAAGFAMGAERALLALENQKKKAQQAIQAAREAGEEIPEQKPNTEGVPTVFFAHLGEQARRRTLKLVEMLRQEGITLHHTIGKKSLKAQLEVANKFGATHSIILGQKELQDNTIIVRDMTSGIQEIVDQKKLPKEIRKILEG